MRRVTSIVGMLVLIAISAGCQSTKDIPIFNPKARTLNQVASAQELLIECNDLVSSSVAMGLMTQLEADRVFGPSLDKASRVIKATRAVVLSTTQPTTQPEASLAQIRELLLSIRAVLIQIRGSSNVNADTFQPLRRSDLGYWLRYYPAEC